MSRVRCTLLVLLAVLVAAPAAEAKAKRLNVAVAAQACADADLEPAPDNMERIRDAVLCLHNRVRSQRDLPPLRENPRLRRAAIGHSQNMVSAGFFEHTAPSGATMVDRILRAGYVRRNEGWSLGENLAWGTGSFSTPRGALESWMDSPAHRANVLKRSYRELGVGLVAGVPVSDAAGATYTVDFGVKR